MTPAQGRVILVGAGPGAPDLVTVRGRRALRAADAVVFDSLAPSELVDLAPPAALRVDVGRRGHEQPGRSQESISALLVELAREGRTVVRLKGGDPFVFGRGGEEWTACREAGVAVEVVPGVSAAIAAPAAAGVPLTDRRFAASFAVVTGHKDPTRARAEIDWDALSRAADTLVVLMGMRNLEEICQRLLAAGRSPETPALVVMNASRPDQRVVDAPLAALAERARAAGLGAPATLVVGEVARLRDAAGYARALPLHGLRVLLTRPAAQSQAWASALVAAGAEPISRPMIRIEPLLTPEVDKALAGLRAGAFHGLLFTSGNGVRALAERAEALGVADAARRVPAHCVGPATASAARAAGFACHTVARRTDAEGLAAELAGAGTVAGQRYLWPGAEAGRDALAAALRRAGAQVDSVAFYRTLPADFDAAALREELRRGAYGVLVFASPSAVRAFAGALDDAARDACRRARVAAIGAVTAEALAAAGLAADVVPERADAGTLVAALVRASGGGRAPSAAAEPSKGGTS